MSENNILLYKTIFAQSPVSTQIFTLDGETIMVNEAWEKLWNIRFAELKHYNVLKDQQLEEQGIMKFIKKGFKGEMIDIPAIEYVPAKSVSIKDAVPGKWVAARIFPIKDAKGKLTNIVLQHEDITHRKKTEELNARLAAIVESSEDAIVSKTLDGIIRSWNQSAEKLFGHTAKEAIGKHISIIIPKHLMAEEEYIIGRLKRGLRVEHFETTRIRKDGTYVQVSLSISPIKDGDGKVVGASKIARDVTQQKLAEEELRISEERLRIALDAGRIGVWDWNVQEDTLIWSDKVYEIHGVSKESFTVGVSQFAELIHPEDKKWVMDLISRVLKGKAEFNVSFRIITSDGETRWITTSATVTRDEKGKPIRMLGATSDITKEKNLEQERNDFVGIATHELKTPVTSLKAYAEVLQRKFAKEGDMFSSTQLGKMNAQLDKLTMLISDLLDVTKIESGKLRMHHEKFDFDAFVTEIAEELQRTTERHTVSVKTNTKKKVYADRERIGQVLTNLISNAIKYSPHTDKVIVKASATDTHVKVCVQDFGVGIPASKQGRLFERFYRASGAKENTFPGLGLGLYISQEIMKRQQGILTVDSALGKGSTFCFQLPITVKEEKVRNSSAESEIQHD